MSYQNRAGLRSGDAVRLVADGTHWTVGGPDYHPVELTIDDALTVHGVWKNCVNVQDGEGRSFRVDNHQVRTTSASVPAGTE